MSVWKGVAFKKTHLKHKRVHFVCDIKLKVTKYFMIFRDFKSALFSCTYASGAFFLFAYFSFLLIKI